MAARVADPRLAWISAEQRRYDAEGLPGTVCPESYHIEQPVVQLYVLAETEYPRDDLGGRRR
jgi:hypothetical protein